MRRYLVVYRRVNVFVVFGIIIFLISFRLVSRKWLSNGCLMNEKEAAGYSADSNSNFIAFNLNNPTPIVFPNKTSERRKYDFVIGVPSFARPSRISYLDRTLRSLIENSQRDQNNPLSIHIVVLLNNYSSETIHLLVSNFSTSIDQRIIEFVIPPSHFYDLLNADKRPPTYNDKAERIYWRKRQNLDFAYLIAYCSLLSTKYYLQMEDDAIAARNFVSKTLQFIESLKDPDWFMLGLAKLGLYGKLFKAQDMTALATHIYNFYWVKPVDWTVYEIIHLLCDENQNKCRSDATKRFVYDLHQLKNTSLFQHIGESSSFNADVNKLSEGQFFDG